jgi:hypothetical protein
MVLAHWPEFCRHYICYIKGTFTELQHKLDYKYIFIYVCFVSDLSLITQFWVTLATTHHLIACMTGKEFWRKQGS